MIREEIRKFVEGINVALVASANGAGVPHIAAGTDLKVQDEEYLVFENWFCESTLRNVMENPEVAVVVTTSDLLKGYQFFGTMSQLHDEAILNGFIPGGEKSRMPQVLVRMMVRVERVMEFSSGMHTDLPLT